MGTANYIYESRQTEKRLGVYALMSKEEDYLDVRRECQFRTVFFWVKGN